jgi:hypothetical protein
VQKERAIQAQATNSQLESYNPEALQKSDPSEVRQQIRSINKEDKPAEPDNSESGPVLEVQSSSSKPDRSEGNKSEAVVVSAMLKERHWTQL